MKNSLGQHYRATGELISLSEQQILDCNTDCGGGCGGCDGGDPDHAFVYIQQQGGLDTEDSYPYLAYQEGYCYFDPSNVGATDIGLVRIEDEDDLMAAVATIVCIHVKFLSMLTHIIQGPISVLIDASHDSFQSISGEEVYDDCDDNINLDHAVLVVGYGTNYYGQDYWLIKNSWGTWWGDQGYFRYIEVFVGFEEEFPFR